MMTPSSDDSLEAATLRPNGPRLVHMLVWDGVELLDFAGPAQVLRVAGDGGAFRLRTLSADGAPVTSQGFLRILPDGDLRHGSGAGEEVPDLLVVPGGETAVAAADRRIMNWLERMVPRAGHTLSVCTGALLLARVGFLAHREATTWHGALDELRRLEPTVLVREGARWVSEGRLTTAAGVTAGIDAALHLVERWLGREEAERVADYMEHRRIRVPGDGFE